MENDGAMAEAAMTLDEVPRVSLESPPQCMPADGVPVREGVRGCPNSSRPGSVNRAGE